MHRLIVTSADLPPAARTPRPSRSPATRSERAAGPGSSVPDRGRDDPGRRARGQRPAGDDDRRAERAIRRSPRASPRWPTAGGLADERRPRPLPPGPVHLLEADLAVRRVHHVGRADLGHDLPPPRAVEHAAAGADLLNDTVFVEAAQALARRVVREAPEATAEARIVIRLPPLPGSQPRAGGGFADLGVLRRPARPPAIR